MSTSRTSPSQPPSAAQLTAARAERLAQDGNAVLTAESARAWMQRVGLALYQPRPDQLSTPAPCFAEATVGAATPELSPEQAATARELLLRLVAEGACVPLNLFGGTGSDVPDFVCSPAVFSFLFTLRGNKTWKSAPSTSGPVRVSPLALNTYELIAQKSTLSAYDLATQLGKEVTEAAVLRALCELWQQLRVLPVPQQDGTATQWELATTRFTRQIKAGANAGQPTALSALISLYLQTVLAASEEDVETFLSPLAPRSRVRSILHDLLAGRQLETVAVEGQTLVYLSGSLPDFGSGQAAGEDTPGAQSGSAPAITGEGRIRKFSGDPAAKLTKGLRVRPASAGKPSFGKRDDRERSPARPGGRDGEQFRKPWAEKRSPRETPGEAAGDGGEQQARPPFRSQRPPFRSQRQDDRAGAPAGRQDRPFRPRPQQDGGEGRAPFRRPSFQAGEGDGRPNRREGSRPGGDFRPRPERAGFSREGERPFHPRREGGFPPSGDGEQRGGFRPRPTGDRPRFFGGDRPRPFGNDRPRGAEDRPRSFGNDRPRPAFGDRPRTFGNDRSRPAEGDRPRSFGNDRPRPPFGDRPRTFGNDRPRPFGGDRPRSFGGDIQRPAGGDRPGGFAPRAPREDRAGGDRPRFGNKPFGKKPFAGKPFGAKRPDAPGGEATGQEGARPPFRRFDAPRGPRPGGGKRPPFAGARGGEGRPSGGGARPFAGKGGSFSRRPQGKGPGRPGGKPSADGGFTPVRRRPEEEA